MNWPDLLGFVPLAILCNTLLPVPFDPVLIYFAARQSPSAQVLAPLQMSLSSDYFMNGHRTTG